MPRGSSAAAAAAVVPATDQDEQQQQSAKDRKRSAAAAATAAQAKVPNLDRVIHERIRLGIVSALAANEHVTFNDLKKLLSTTDGNLSVHARKLEEAGYVICTKSFEGRMPKTEYRLTDEGRSAFSRYLSHMEALIQVARSGTR
jgi:DNA-binding transcriptional ArsR family regulator